MLRITVFDVGQGSCALLDFGGGLFGLVDFGALEPNRKNRVVEYLRRRLTADQEARILFLVITHLDLDHISGLAELLTDELVSARIQRIYCNALEYRTLVEILRGSLRGGSGVTRNSGSRQKLESLGALIRTIVIRGRRDPDFHAELISPAGTSSSQYPVKIEIPRLPSGVDLWLLSPSQRLRDFGLRALVARRQTGERLLNPPLAIRFDWNAASAVLAVEYAGRRILLAGDATAWTWDEIIGRANEVPLLCDIVVAWHHGSRLGTLHGRSLDPIVWERILGTGEKSRERYVVVSAGCGNRYGHPHYETIENVVDRNASLLCTERRTRTQQPPAGNWFPFQMVGAALEFGTPSDVAYYRASENFCCGDITFELNSQGDVRWVDALPQVKLVHKVSPECCLHGMRATGT